MPTYSNSRLIAHENCPLKYNLQYIDHIKPPEEEEGLGAFVESREEKIS
jgi:hypothetical protein